MRWVRVRVRVHLRVRVQVRLVRLVRTPKPLVAHSVQSHPHPVHSAHLPYKPHKVHRAHSIWRTHLTQVEREEFAPSRTSHSAAGLHPYPKNRSSEAHALRTLLFKAVQR